MKIMMYKHGQSRPAQEHEIELFESAGWSRGQSAVVDSGAVKLKAPKKKAEKPADTEPEAAQESLDNAINTGE
jgi:hypothetical protein